MPQLFIYEPQRGGFCQYTVALSDRVPGMRLLPLRIMDFLYLAKTDMAWTHRGALDALDGLCADFGAPFSVDVAFRCFGACSGAKDVHHFAGQAFEIGRTLKPAERSRLYHAALRMSKRMYVAPRCLSGRSVRICKMQGVPVLRPGDQSTYVFVLQQALLRLGLYRGALTGRFCEYTCDGVRRLQRFCGHTVTGHVMSAEWRGLLQLTNALGDAKI